MRRSHLRVVFFGTPDFAKNILEIMLPHFEIIALVTQGDKPFGRKQIIKYPKTKEFILESAPQIPIFQPKKISEITPHLKALKPDILLVVAFGRILPREITDEFYCVNIHGSLLPKYRGASPIHEMILKESEFLGVTLIKMNERLDSGDILGFSLIKNRHFDIEQSLEILSKMGAKLALKILKNLNAISPLKQSDADSSECKKLSKTDGIITFKNAKEIFLKSLAYKIYPQIMLESGLKLFGVTINELDSTNNSGEILSIEKSCVIIGCESGSIAVESLQKIGKNKVSALDFINGMRLKKGDILR